MTKKKLTGSEFFVKCPNDDHIFKTGKKEPQCWKCGKELDAEKCRI